MDGTKKRIITRLRGGIKSEEKDSIALEVPLRVLANGKELFSLYCTPLMVRELVVGFVMSENIFEEGAFCAERMSISYEEDMITVDIPVGGHAPPGNKAKRRAIITSGCTGGITFEKRQASRKPIKGGPRVQASVLTELFAKFQQASALHRETGCVHSACLTDGSHILCLAEDIGRHNAVDKIIGWAVLEGDIRLEDKMLLSSGRLSSEIAAKCAAWRIPVLASRAAPTSRAIDIAQKAGITLIGFLRGKNCNVYTHPERIKSAR
jgi:FdhD protein